MLAAVFAGRAVGRVPHLRRAAADRGAGRIANRGVKSRVLSHPGPRPGGHGVCAAYCAPGPIDLGGLSEYIGTRSGRALQAGSVALQAGGDVAHAALRVHEADAPTDHAAHAFFFSSGAAVFWDVPLSARLSLVRDLRELAPSAASPMPVQAYPAMDDRDHEFEYSIATGAPRFREDRITLPSPDEPGPMLAVSHGLAQSVQLALHEAAIDALVSRTRALPAELAATGRTGMGRRALKRCIGELIAARYSVSLVSDILDTPEFFWQNPSLEGLYLECAAAVELRPRAAVLEARVQVLRDSLDLLNNELSSRSSDRVERAILALIAVEVVIELARLAPALA